jgi:putative methyltransferase (TIGR04325 family)
VRGPLRQLFDRARAHMPSAVRCTGNYSTWDDALRDSAGYHDPEVLRRAVEAARLVREGNAAFERDGVAFARSDFRWPVLCALYRLAARTSRLHVLDFGGALGSIYYQHRMLLADLPQVRWAIVEQAAHVEAGRAEFRTAQLDFYHTVDEALTDAPLDALLLSGVLQTLQTPYDFLAEAVERRFPTIILDRVPLMKDDTTRLTVQHVPRRIYAASYPAWFLSESRLLAIVDSRYRLVTSWPGFDRVQPRGGLARHRGYLFEMQ